jgi:DNA uptake protein ComE-like DNA-binding protein
MKKMNVFFECSASERRGMLVLSLLVLLLLGARLAVKLLPPPPLPPLDEEQYRRYLSFVERQQFLSDSLDAVRVERRKAYTERYNRPRTFRYGSEYRGRVPEHVGTVLYPVDSNRPVAIRKYPEKRALTAAKVELNTADTLLLCTVPGIGPRTAREIGAYRERLGGFADMNQLLEIRMMDSARWLKALPYLSLDTVGMLHKLHINQADIKELMRHPYMDYYLAKTIVVWRENKGRFRSLDEMRSATRIYPELFERLKPYLTIQ